MLSSTLELTLRKALYIASVCKHEYATYEHLLMALIDDHDIKAFFNEKKIDSREIAQKLTHYVQNDLIDLVNDNIREAKPTAGFQRILQRAALHTQANGQKIITGVDLLTEFFFEHDCFALTCLKEANLKRIDIINYIKNRNNKAKNSVSSSNISGFNAASGASKKETTKKPYQETEVVESYAGFNKHQSYQHSGNDKVPPRDTVKNIAAEIEKYCTNLNEKALENDIDCLVGRQEEIQRTIEILCRRKKNNAILVGEPGVGKTAIAEGLAIRIVKGDVPDFLKDAIIYSLDIGNLVAGTKFRGDFEERVKIMLECLKKSEHAILFIDEIHSIIGAGSTTTGALDASNLLKPALASGDLRCIGSTTFKEYKNYFEKDMALVRRFQKIIIEEPNKEVSFNILTGLKGYYEDHHGVTYTDGALRAAVDLAERYINDRHLPDKAIDLIDEAGSRVKTQNAKNKNFTITEKEIESLVASIVNIPQFNLELNDIKQIMELEGNLKANIFGQDEAIERLCASFKLSKAGLRKPARPMGCYLFVGPTGVGKTELAKQMANFCNMKILKYDMSEFAEMSAVSKLIGSAPGYIGFDQGGILTEDVSKYPYSVVLFDEIEKAHSEIYNILLQVMDEGVLTDNTGKKISFTNCVIILTSNVMANNKARLGFSGSSNSSENINMDEINQEFSAEFRSRLDKIILFNPINGIINEIVNKNLKELEDQLADKNIRLSVTKNVRSYFADKCSGSQNGARNLGRAIDHELKQQIAEAILFGQLKNGGLVEIDYAKKKQAFVFKFTGSKEQTDDETLETN